MGVSFIYSKIAGKGNLKSLLKVRLLITQRCNKINYDYPLDFNFK
jgi:hypothetical protein